MNKPYRTQAQIELDFSKEEGIARQKQQLKGFAAVMSAQAFEKLEQLVTENNATAFDGYDITRGVDIDEIFHNIVIPMFA